MRDLIFFSAFIALLGFFGVVRGEDEKPSSQGQLRLHVLPGETTATFTRPRDDQTAQQGGMIISCESMTLDQGRFIFKNGTLETSAGYLSFAEIAVTFSERSISISSPTPGKSIKDIQFHLRPGHAMPSTIPASQLAPPR